MTHGDCPVPIDNPSLSKFVDFGQVEPFVIKKKNEKKTMIRQFLVKAKYFM